MNSNDPRIQHLCQYQTPDQIRTNSQERAEIKFLEHTLLGFIRTVQTQIYIEGIMHYKSGNYLRGYKKLVESSPGEIRKRGTIEIPLGFLQEYNKLIRESSSDLSELEDKASNVPLPL